jgi:ribulose 1,5-bisphosphate carboxylase large subunit-like protein
MDLLYMAGGGIMAHPDGPAAGVRVAAKVVGSGGRRD